MKAKLLSAIKGANGKTVLIFEADSVPEVDSEYVDIAVKPYKEKRSRDANAYFWTLADKLAAAVGIPKTEIYREAIRDIGGVSTTVCVPTKAVEKLRAGWSSNGIGWITDTMPSKIDNCTNVILYYGSSAYDSKQMHRLIEIIVQECKQHNIETLTPGELAGLRY